MATSDGAEERRRERAERAAVEENGKVFFGFRISDGAVGVVRASSCRLRWGSGGGGGLRRGRERNIPEAVGGVAFSSDDDFVVFDDVDVVFCEKGDAVVVAQLADGDEGAGLEVVKNMTDLGGGGEFGGERNSGASG